MPYFFEDLQPWLHCSPLLHNFSIYDILMVCLFPLMEINYIGCGRLWVIDGQWKLMFSHCMMQRKVIIQFSQWIVIVSIYTVWVILLFQAILLVHHIWPTVIIDSLNPVNVWFYKQKGMAIVNSHFTSFSDLKNP